MKKLFFVIALLLICASCRESKKDHEMTSYDKVMLFKANNPIGEKLGFGDVILDSVIIYGDNNVDSVRICLLYSTMSDAKNTCCSISAIANWNNGELLDSLCLTICDYCNMNGEKVRVFKTPLLYDYKNLVAFKDCRNKEQMQIMKEVVAANNTLPRQLDRYTTMDRIRYSPNTGNYICRFTLSEFDNDAVDLNKIGSIIKNNAIWEQKLLIKKSKDTFGFYKLLETQKILIKYEYYSASTAKCLFTFTIRPGQLLKH